MVKKLHFHFSLPIFISAVITVFVAFFFVMPVITQEPVDAGAVGKQLVKVGSINTTGYPTGLAFRSGYTYIPLFSGSQSQLQVIDTKDVTKMKIVKTINTDFEPRYLFINGYNLYVLTYGGVLHIFDITNPADPALINKVSVGYATNSLYATWKYVYVTDAAENALRIYDVSNPHDVKFVSTTPTEGMPYKVILRNSRYAYVINYQGNTLKVFDLINATHPAIVKTVSVQTHPITIKMYKNNLYIVGAFLKKMEIFDISLPTNPTLVSSTVLNGTGMDIDINNDTAFVLHNNPVPSISVYNVSNPASPSIITNKEISAFPQNLLIAYGRVYTDSSSPNVLEIHILKNLYR